MTFSYLMSLNILVTQYKNNAAIKCTPTFQLNKSIYCNIEKCHIFSNLKINSCWFAK